MSASVERSRRRGAGSGIKRLIEKEETDDFYKTAYGGFAETKDDEDFVVSEESNTSSDDIDSEESGTESDDENDDNEKSTQDSDTEKKKRSKSKISAKKSTKMGVKNTAKTRSSVKSKSNKLTSTDSDTDASSARVLRPRIKSQILVNQKARSKTSNGGIKKRSAMTTQEQMLEEAKLTEKLNLESLRTFVRLEESKKPIVRCKKRRELNEPYVRIVSTSLPKSEILSEEALITATTQENSDRNRTSKANGQMMVTRNLVTFCDVPLPFREDSHENGRPAKSAKSVKTELCVITGRLAKYRDPATQQPFADLESFRAIRKKLVTKSQVSKSLN